MRIERPMDPIPAHDVDVTALEFPPVHALPLEIVERKGIGHPDTICDALAETFSSGLSRFYLERFGTVLHHNVDKALLCGGAAQPSFGGGRPYPERDVRIVTHVRPTSPDLATLFRREGESSTPLANDTSFGVGFAPLDELERVVLVKGHLLHRSRDESRISPGGNLRRSNPFGANPSRRRSSHGESQGSLSSVPILVRR